MRISDSLTLFNPYTFRFLLIIFKILFFHFNALNSDLKEFLTFYEPNHRFLYLCRGNIYFGQKFVTIVGDITDIFQIN